MRERSAARSAEDTLGLDAGRADEAWPRVGQVFVAIGAIEFRCVLWRGIDDKQLHGHGPSPLIRGVRVPRSRPAHTLQKHGEFFRAGPTNVVVLQRYASPATAKKARLAVALPTPFEHEQGSESRLTKDAYHI